MPGREAIAIRRARRAWCFVLAALLVALLLSGIAQCVARFADGALSVDRAVSATQDVLAGASAEEVISRLMGKGVQNLDEGFVRDGLPDVFVSSVRLPEGVANLRVDESLFVVGYEWDGSAEDAIERLEVSMGELGWRSASLGSVDGCSFVRSAGEMRYALATATSFGDARSSVVLRLAE